MNWKEDFGGRLFDLLMFCPPLLFLAGLLFWRPRRYPYWSPATIVKPMERRLPEY